MEKCISCNTIRRNLEEVKWEEVLVDNFKESYEIFLGRLTESLEGKRAKLYKATEET